MFKRLAAPLVFAAVLLAGCVNPRVAPYAAVDVHAHDEGNQASGAWAGATFHGDRGSLTVAPGVRFDLGGESTFDAPVYGVRIEFRGAD